MKICKYCKKEIDKKASICPYCRKRQRNTTWAWIVVILVIIAIASNFSGFKNELDIISDENRFDVKYINGGAENLTCFVNGKITNKTNTTFYNCTIKYSLINEKNNEIVAYVDTTIKSIDPNQTLEFKAKGLCTESGKKYKFNQEKIECK